MIAAQKGRGSVIRWMFAAGADPDVQNRSGQTALMLAALAGRLRPVRALVEGGASLDLVNRKRETALTYAIVWRRPKVVEALLRAGADVEKPGGPWSPLMYAAFEGDLRSARLLLRRGANRSRKDAHGRTAADIARDARHFKLLAALRSKEVVG
jgi:ankyrin repeat protein